MKILNNRKGDPLEIQHPKFETAESVALTSRSVRRRGVGGGVEQHNILDQYLTTGIVQYQLDSFKGSRNIQFYSKNF